MFPSCAMRLLSATRHFACATGLDMGQAGTSALGREEALLRRRQGAAVRAVPDELGVVPACVFGGASTASTPWTPVSWDIFVIQRSYARPPPTTRTVPPAATVENLGR